MSTPTTVTLRVDGMSCSSCVAVVRRALTAVPDTSDVNVDLDKGLATLKYPADADVDRLIEAVSKDAGKTASRATPDQ